VETTPLTVADASQIATFTRVACPFDLLSTGSVERSIFHEPDDPLLVVGVFDGGLDAVAACVVRGQTGWVKFLAVHPRVRLQRIGTNLLAQLESFAKDHGATSMQVGNSAPFFVVPGVDPRITEAVTFFAARGYQRAGDAVNQSVSLRTLATPELDCHTAEESDLERMMPWVREHYPFWIQELTRAVELGTCVAHEDLGFACFDVLRDAWFGPMATRPDLRGKHGVGTSTLLSALHRMRARGYEHADIVWSGPLLFYLKTVGARVNRVFWWFSKNL
jgi:GNAT superfamily N-acetyltransferase